MEEILVKRIGMRQDQLELYMNTVKTEYEASEMPFGSATTAIFRIKDFISKLDYEVKFYMEKSLDPKVDVVEAAMDIQLKSEDLLSCLQVATNGAHGENTCPTERENNTMTTRLPKLELKKYKGDRLRWSEFWDTFNTNIHGRNIAEADKLTYLFSCLEGVALDAIAGLTITNANYPIALNILMKRFGSNDEVIDAHYNAINQLPRAEYNAISCRTTLDEVERHLRVLEKLGEPSNGNHFRAMVLSKFPGKVVHDYHLMRQDSENNMGTIRKCLQRIIISMESSQEDIPVAEECNSTSTTEALHIRSEQITGPSKPEVSTLYVNRKRRSDYADPPPNKRSRLPCLFCNLNNHNSTDCKKYTTVEVRKQRLTGRCFKCLQRNHKADECRRTIKCFRCNGDHLQMLCPNPKSKKIDFILKNNNKTDVTQQMISNHPTTFLQTAVAQIQNPNNKRETKCRVVLDSGSQRSYISQKFSKALGLSSKDEDLLLVYTFGESIPKRMVSPSTEISIKTKRGITKQIKVNIVPHITDRLPIAEFEGNGIDFPADDISIGTDIGLLVGNDYYANFMREEKVRLRKDQYAINTDFGWVLSGGAYQENLTSNQRSTLTVTTYCHCHNSSCPYFTEPDLPLRNIDIRFLWSLECIGITDSPKTTRQEEAVKHFNDTLIYQEGRYEVKWPWIEHPPQLASNFGLAFGRLKGLIMRSDLNTLQEYDDIIKEQLKSKVIEQVEPHNNNLTHPLHYLPHHMVKQEGKRSRIVYDASAKTSKQKSLNECLFSGPSMIENLTTLLLQFRTKMIGVVADVEKAFLQVGLQKEDRDVTRFLWVKDLNRDLSEENLLYLRFCRVPFGIISSPFLLTATIRHHMSQSEEDLLKTIANKCYVDNLVTGANSLNEAKQIYTKTRETFAQMSMNIRDWVSNNEDVMASIPTEHRANKNDIVKVLGLLWNVSNDTLQLNLNENHFNPNFQVDTKRRVLQTLARFYDPCGFIAPLLLPMKLLFQNICEQKHKWDAKLPINLIHTLETILRDLKVVVDVQLPRYVGDSSDPNAEYELHGFSDASSKYAYAAVVYLKVTSSQRTTVSFIMGKSHVAQTKDKDDLKIPRLELLGFLIASRLLKYIKSIIELPIRREILWTDSLVVLGWIHSNKLLPPFVANRVDEIKRDQQQTEMLYISTKLNPADIATKPGTWEQNKELWLYGPDFLKMDESYWPEDRHYNSHMVLFLCGEALDQSPEKCPMETDQFNRDLPLETGNAYTPEQEALDHNQQKDPMEAEEFNQNQPIETEDPYTSTKDKTEEEYRESLSEYTGTDSSSPSNLEIKQIQIQHFPDEMTGKTTHLSKNLDLFLDTDGILRCRGRMANTFWSYDMKYPVLLPKYSDLTNKIIKETHERNYHVGVSHTLSMIREKYWIPQGRVQVQKIIKRCHQCVKHGGGPYQLPATPALPPERVNYSEPFTFTGIDYFGPLYVDSKNGKEKRWVALFTCLAVRAIHLEVVTDLTAEECLLALRRFSATRKTPKRIYSDNAKYFKLTSEVVKKPFCVEEGIQWKFIPQLAPWHGGFYERLVSMVKHCLKRTLEKHLLGDSKLLTVIKEVEAVVNSRPLVRVGTEVEHVLRPADFLSLGRCLQMKPSSVPSVGTTLKIDLIQSWKRGLKIIEEFKNMFIGQYLSNLRDRFQNSPKQPRIKTIKVPRVGDLVQIKSEARNRNNWKVGRIIELIRGADGECRVAKVEVEKSIFIRSIGHLYPLETDDDKNPITTINQAGTPIEDNISHHSDLEAAEKVEEVELVPHEVLLQDHLTPSFVETSTRKVQLESQADNIDQGPVVDHNSQEKTGKNEDSPEPHVEVEDRSRRRAAIQAREKILEWTRELINLLH